MDVKTLDVLQNKIQAIHDDQRLKLELTQIGERFKNELASTLDGLDVTVERDTRHGCPYKIVFDANGRRYIPLVRTVASKGHRHVFLHRSQLAELEGQELDALAILTRSSEAADASHAFQAIESCESMPWLKEPKEAHASMAGFVERKLPWYLRFMITDASAWAWRSRTSTDSSMSTCAQKASNSFVKNSQRGWIRGRPIVRASATKGKRRVRAEGQNLIRPDIMFNTPCSSLLLFFFGGDWWSRATETGAVLAEMELTELVGPPVTLFSMAELRK